MLRLHGTPLPVAERRRWPAQSALALTLALSLASAAAAQTQAGWRYWTQADGI